MQVDEVGRHTHRTNPVTVRATAERSFHVDRSVHATATVEGPRHDRAEAT